MSKVISIKENPKTEVVYDLACKAPNHNYFSNGFVSHNCVVLIDEIDSTFSKEQGENDGGVKKEILGMLQTFMAKSRDNAVYFVMTANRGWMLPAPLTRKGRIDQEYYVGNPNATERKAIIDIKLRKFGITSIPESDIPAFVEASDNYTGSEIEEAIIATMRKQFSKAKNKELSVDDVIENLQESEPNSVKHKEQTAKMIKWAEDNCKPASLPDVSAAVVATKQPIPARRGRLTK